MRPVTSPLLRIEHLSLRVLDLEASLHWYRDLIGLAEVDRRDGHVYLAVGDKPTWDLCLSEGGTGLEYFSGSVADSESLEELAQRLRAAGTQVDPVTELAPMISQAFEFSLPGGQRMRAVIPENRQNYTNAASKYFGAHNLLKELHHVNLSVVDIPALERFLVENLEMKTSDHVLWAPGGPIGLAFWRMAENHHDIGAIRTATDGLHHFAFVVSGVGHLVAIADRFASSDLPIVENGIGRHGCGNNLFLYVRDPSGNIVEFSGDVARITDRSAPHRVWDTPARAGNAWGDVQPPPDFLSTVT